MEGAKERIGFTTFENSGYYELKEGYNNTRLTVSKDILRLCNNVEEVSPGCLEDRVSLECWQD